MVGRNCELHKTGGILTIATSIEKTHVNATRSIRYCDCLSVIAHTASDDLIIHRLLPKERRQGIGFVGTAPSADDAVFSEGY